MFNQEEYIKVLNYVSSAYDEQKTPKNFPYISHVTLVAMEVINACEQSKLEEKKSNLAISTALLHNIIDDTNITYDDLYVEFSEEIANGVESLSKDKSLISKQEQMKKSIEMLLEQPYEVQMVKLAHSIIDLSSASKHWDNDKKMAYIKESSFILSCLKNSNIYLSSRLEEKIENYRNIVIKDL